MYMGLYAKYENYICNSKLTHHKKSSKWPQLETFAPKDETVYFFEETPI